MPDAKVRVLVIEDDAPIRRLLREALEQAGYGVVEAANAAEALALVQETPPLLALLDLGLPDRDGMELVPLLRKAGLAVLVLSARDASAEKVAALDLGADDYVTKPFDAGELLARIRTALRHRAAPQALAATVVRGDVEIDLAARIVRRGGVPVHLAPKEYAVLAELAAQPGRVITHAALLRAVWGPGHEGDVEYLRVAARGIRRKLEQEGSGAAGGLIRNEPAVGYRLSDS
ncbi:response regulator [Novosphingobium cyanobacteriorum]|uniref:Response regulator transcription factor n=1 Tax=Novosphingobium cyanobacteriorum TaxID=3024215 RepID=A0ABT6CHL5_9SPHN|nr:response regulator transcription factor [Novosphingobium cyanobacteriorum]MDF8333297.1 response regulator transcription factor [Novosphingobium cyanobacteriorum]